MAPRTRLSTNARILVAALAMIVLLAAIVLWDRSRGVHFTIAFSDSQGLAAGAPVELAGNRIGNVEKVTLVSTAPPITEVRVRVLPEHRLHVHAPPNVTARIKKDLVSLKGPYVELFNRGDALGGIPDGARVDGLDGWTDQKIWSGTAAVEDSFGRALHAGRDHLDRLEEWSQSPEGQRLRGDIQGFLKSVGEAAESGTVKAREQWDDTLERGTVLLERFREEKAPQAQAAAEEFRASLEKLLEDNKDAPADARKKLEDLIESLRRQTGATSS